MKNTNKSTERKSKIIRPIVVHTDVSSILVINTFLLA